MLKVEYKIGPKPEGNWHTPLWFQITIQASKEILALNSHFVFKKEYELPEEILTSKYDKLAIDVIPCGRINKIIFNINTYVTAIESFRIPTSPKGNCSPNSCYYKGCNLHLPLRPGVPDYSDYEAVFKQIAQDVIEAWNDAVRQAKSLLEYKEKHVTITSDDYTTNNKTQPTEAQPLRKVKI